MSRAYAVLLAANVIYGTSYVAVRLVLADVPPIALAFARLVLGAVVMVALTRALEPARAPLSAADHRTLAWMGVLGFAGAAALSHWGLALSTASNAALLITAEPVALLLLSPLLLGERLTRRESAGAALTVAGAVAVILDGLPGTTAPILPYWRGDLLLVLSGVAYASYTLFGRRVLARHRPLPVTTWSILYGAAAIAPLAALEWLGGARPRVTPAAVAGTLYLAVVITALGYTAWNYALEQVEAPRAAVFLNVQPLVGAALGVWWLGEPATPFLVAGGALILLGLHLALTGRRTG